jgi:serine/threonine protein phosphatase PrpC
VDEALAGGGHDNVTVVLLQAQAERRRSLLAWFRDLFTA